MYKCQDCGFNAPEHCEHVELQAEIHRLNLQVDEARKALEIISEFDARDFAQFGAQALMDAVAVAKIGLSKMKPTEKPNDLGLDLATYEAAKKEQAEGKRVPLEQVIEDLGKTGKRKGETLECTAMEGHTWKGIANAVDGFDRQCVNCGEKRTSD